MTGPSINCLNVLTQYDGKETEFSTHARSMYGYSGSDVDKLMDVAINHAARRAISKPTNIFNENIINEQTYWIFNPTNGQREGNRALLKDLNVEDRKFVLTFDITPVDICYALAQNSSTVKPEMYKKLVKYAGFYKDTEDKK